MEPTVQKTELATINEPQTSKVNGSSPEIWDFRAPLEIFPLANFFTRDCEQFVPKKLPNISDASPELREMPGQRIPHGFKDQKGGSQDEKALEKGPFDSVKLAKVLFACRRHGA